MGYRKSVINEHVLGIQSGIYSHLYAYLFDLGVSENGG